MRPPAVASDNNDVAVVGTDQGLVAVSVQTGQQRLLHAGRIDACVLDNASRVVWYVAEDELRGHDLTDGQDLVLVHGGMRGLSWLSVETRGAVLNEPDTDDSSLQVRLRVSDQPTVSARLGCEGDSAATCGIIEDDDVFAQKQAELRKDVRRIARTKLRNAAFVRQAAARTPAAAAPARCDFVSHDAGIAGLASE